MTNKSMTAEDRSIMLANFLFADPAADIIDEIEVVIRQAEQAVRQEENEACAKIIEDNVPAYGGGRLIEPMCLALSGDQVLYATAIRNRMKDQEDG